MPDLDRLRELNRRLTALLDDPQPGLFSWCQCLAEVMRDLAGMWTTGRPAPESE